MNNPLANRRLVLLKPLLKGIWRSPIARKIFPEHIKATQENTKYIEHVFNHFEKILRKAGPKGLDNFPEMFKDFRNLILAIADEDDGYGEYAVMLCKIIEAHKAPGLRTLPPFTQQEIQAFLEYFKDPAHDRMPDLIEPEFNEDPRVKRTFRSCSKFKFKAMTE